MDSQIKKTNLWSPLGRGTMGSNIGVGDKEIQQNGNKDAVYITRTHSYCFVITLNGVYPIQIVNQYVTPATNIVN